MNFAGLIFLIFAHFFSGKGLLRLFKIQLPVFQQVCLAFMIGVPVISFGPCFVQLMGFPIVMNTMLVATVIVTLVCSLPLLMPLRKPRMIKLAMPELYELPFLLIIIGLLIISAWRAWYFPPTARDVLSGPELLAEYAVKEKNMISSVFTIDLRTTNNYFKSPYLTCLQILYKIIVCPFGQLWLTVLSTSFVCWLYVVIREKCHPLLSAFLVFFFLITPDVYSYSFIILYDYSNMVFFFCGFYFLSGFLTSRKLNELILAAFLFGLATYIRTETLVLVTFILPMLLFYFYKRKTSLLEIGKYSAILLSFSAVLYFVCIDVFVKKFVIIPLDIKSQVNTNLLDLSVLVQRFLDMNFALIFSPAGVGTFAYFIYFFGILFFVDLIFFRKKYNHEARIALYGVAVVYFGVPFLGYLLPLFDLGNTTKRALFKAVPLMVWYLSNGGLFAYLTGKLSNYELGISKPAKEPGKDKNAVKIPVNVRPKRK